MRIFSCNLCGKQVVIAGISNPRSYGCPLGNCAGRLRVVRPRGRYS